MKKRSITFQEIISNRMASLLIPGMSGIHLLSKLNIELTDKLTLPIISMFLFQKNVNRKFR
jgi:hypothetical protein